MLGTQIRTGVLIVLALIGFFFPGLIPEGAQETIADHAVNLISAVLGLWAVFAGFRLRAQAQGKEPGNPATATRRLL